MEKLVITAALVGAVTTRQQTPNVPYTTEEYSPAQPLMPGRRGPLWSTFT